MDVGVHLSRTFPNVHVLAVHYVADMMSGRYERAIVGHVGRAIAAQQAALRRFQGATGRSGAR